MSYAEKSMESMGDGLAPAPPPADPQPRANLSNFKTPAHLLEDEQSGEGFTGPQRPHNLNACRSVHLRGHKMCA